eukprot:1494762-Prymnesium_polylepis.1
MTACTTARSAPVSAATRAAPQRVVMWAVVCESGGDVGRRGCLACHLLHARLRGDGALVAQQPPHDLLVELGVLAELLGHQGVAAGIVFAAALVPALLLLRLFLLLVVSASSGASASASGYDDGEDLGQLLLCEKDVGVLLHLDAHEVRAGAIVQPGQAHPG